MALQRRRPRTCYHLGVSEMWAAIGNVKTWLGLAAFLGGVAAWVIRERTRREERLVREAPEGLQQDEADRGLVDVSIGVRAPENKIWSAVRRPNERAELTNSLTRNGIWWLRADLNCRPWAYETPALTS